MHEHRRVLQPREVQRDPPQSYDRVTRYSEQPQRLRSQRLYSIGVYGGQFVNGQLVHETHDVNTRLGSLNIKLADERVNDSVNRAMFFE
jgi:hypothetical protein